ncbi:two-component sensor histidine kinase [Agromyces luteolus]|nr:histidine kinase [Agromyces luteolus]GLK28848.1 two-component sensor histidine kinase [Agromyces luteolus]
MSDEDRGRVAPDRMAARRAAPAWVWDVVVVLVAIAWACAPYRGPTPEFLAVEAPAAFALALAQAPVLLLRRRLPLVTYGVVWALMAAGTLVVGSAMPFVVPAAIAAYAMSKRAPRRRVLITVLTSIVLLVGVELIAGAGDGFDPRLIPVPALLAFAAAAGDATRSRRAYVAALAERAERAEATRESEARRRVAEERLRIARDLHDAVAHQIAVINLQSSVAERAIAEGREPDLPRARESVATAARAAREVLGEIGDLLSTLRTESDDATPSAPPAGLADLGRMVDDFAVTGLGVTVRHEVASDAGDVPTAVDRSAYLVLREALTNASKHGADGRAHALIEQDASTLAITVTNATAPGAPRDTGTPAAPGRPAGGHGLLGLRERVAAVRGTLVTGADAGVFRLRAEFPVGPREVPESTDATGREGGR